MTIELNPDLQNEYERVLATIGEEDPYLSQSTLGIHDVLRAHFLIAEFFYESKEGLGGVGPRDSNLLHSALDRQHIAFGGKKKWNDHFHVCATLFYGLIKDHPFYDANKRTAFLCLLYHLQKLGLAPTVAQRELENFTVSVAERNLSKYSVYKEFKRKIDADADVKTIAWYIKGNTRKIDKRYYVITFKQLRRFLNRFGYDLQNPHDNLIDVVRVQERRKIFGIAGPKEQVNVRVAQIGFPGWTKEVNQGAIKTVRREAQLTHEFGVDSASFFQNADPIDCLIAQFQEPLINLANR